MNHEALMKLIETNTMMSSSFPTRPLCCHKCSYQKTCASKKENPLRKIAGFENQKAFTKTMLASCSPEHSILFTLVLHITNLA